MHHDTSSLARIVRVALTHLRWPRGDNVEAVQTRARYEMVRLERGLVILEVIVGIAPLLGLIGTVSGLIHVFASLGLSAGAADAKKIALGISEALSTTIFGLGIAVVTLIAFVYFSKKVEVLSVEIESLVTEILSKCYYGRMGECRSLAAPSGSALRCRASLRSRHEIRGPQKAGAFDHIVSIVDILVILLIFFVVSTTFKTDQSEVQINLPESKTARKRLRNRTHLVTIDPGG